MSEQRNNSRGCYSDDLSGIAQASKGVVQLIADSI